MIDLARITAVVCAVAGPLASTGELAAAAGLQADPTGFAAVSDGLARLTLDPSGVAHVSGLTLTRDAGSLELDGVLVKLAPVGGQPTGLAFVGQGVFSLTPPIRVEREQVARYFDAPSVRQPFSAAALLFTDETWVELDQAGVAFGPGTVPDRADDVVDEARKYLVDDDTKDVDPEILFAFLNRGRPAHAIFHAHMVPEGRSRRLSYLVYAAAEEEVRLGQERSGSGDDYETVSAFHFAEDYRNGVYVGEYEPSNISVEHYAIESTIESNMRFRAEAAVDVRAHEPGGFWTSFMLTTSLRVDSARWESGEPAPFHRHEDGWNLWVRVPESLEAGEVATLRLWYGGSDLLEQTRDWYYLTSAAYWYPRSGRYRDRSTVDLTFHTPERLEFVSVGRRVQDSVTDGVRTTRWVTDAPFVHASFNVGILDRSELRDPRIRPVELTINEEAHRTISLARSRRTGLPGLDLDRVRADIEGDLANSISFFQTWFGEPPITDLRATEIPFNHGQAFPGMIHLSWITFEGMGTEGYDEMFRAHEVAHQWWGLGVSPATYHDAWLSEGFAEFAGLWYLNTVLDDPDRYLDRLRDTKDRILGRRGKAPPTWMGTRAGSSEEPRDYSIMVYEKGAWVLHMLRNIFLDLQTLDESRFVDMISAFYQAQVGKPTTTEDFRRHAEQHLGVELRWFFDQWIYGNQIPTYRVEYCGNENADGTYGVKIRIEQQEVPADFQMYVPIRLDFGDEGSARLRLGVSGPLTELELPPLPGRPREITFNDLESVLADVESERWRCRDDG